MPSNVLALIRQARNEPVDPSFKKKYGEMGAVGGSEAQEFILSFERSASAPPAQKPAVSAIATKPVTSRPVTSAVAAKPVATKPATPAGTKPIPKPAKRG